MSTPIELRDDLRHAGVEVDDLWGLVNTNFQYPSAVPVLLDWLTHVEDRVPEEQRQKVREGLVRSLTIPAARPVAAPILLEEFRKTDDLSGLGLGWVIGNALSVVADESAFDELEALARDRSFGKSRQMIVVGFGRFKGERTVRLLLDLLDDDDVSAHALTALRKLKPSGISAYIEPLLNHPQTMVRREAKKTLAKLPGI